MDTPRLASSEVETDLDEGEFKRQGWGLPSAQAATVELAGPSAHSGLLSSGLSGPRAATTPPKRLNNADSSF